MTKRLAVIPMLALAACESQEPPSACRSIPQVTVHAGDTTTVAACFTDPNGDNLVYSAMSSDSGVATASMSDTTVTVAGVAAGDAMVTVTARDPGGLATSQDFTVTVRYLTVRLTDNDARDAHPAWSPDGTRIAFTSYRDGNSGIYVMDADGGNQTRLTDNNSALAWGHPAWSPDGTQIAFPSDRDGNYEIYVMDADGGNQTRLTNNDAVDWGPAWSPDGTQIAFTSDRDRSFDIYLMDADGGNPTRLTNNNIALGFEPVWSPDGTRIAFTSYRGVTHEIYVMDADGDNPTPLTNNSASDLGPAWSPDGTQIAFASDRESDFPFKFKIYVMDADGGNLTRLANDHCVLRLHRFRWQCHFRQTVDHSPSWSPDGTEIAFVSDRHGNNEIYAIRIR